MGEQEIAAFFDARASKWDQWADDDLSFVRRLLEKIGIKHGERVLDLGCGTGVISGLLHELSGADVLGADVSANMIEIAKKKYASTPGIRFLACPFSKLDEGLFDTIVIYNAYPHFVDVEGLKNKALATLKPHGKLAIVHSISREKLKSHHSGLSSCISRDIGSPEEEYRVFARDFEKLCAEEDDYHYLMVMRMR